MLSMAVAVTVASLASAAVASNSAPSAADASRTARLMVAGESLMPPRTMPASDRQMSSSDTEVASDPHAGSVVLGEVALGFAFVVVADLLSAFTTAIVFLGMYVVGGDILAPTAGIVALVVWAAMELLLAPLFAAFGASAVADREGNNGIGGAVRGAFAVQLVAAALAGAWVWMTTAAGPTLLSNVVAFAAIGLHFLGLPIGASLGIHWGGATSRPSGPGSPPPRGAVIAQLPTRPNELHAAATPTIASPIVAWTF